MNPAFSIPTVQPRHVPDEIADRLRQAIFSRQYLPGDRLPPERDLAQQLQVHRNSVREALKTLEGQGLLRIRQGDGAYVRDFLTEANVSVLEAYLFSMAGQSADTLENIQEFRILVQREMSRLAARRRTDADLSAFDAILSAEALENDPATFRALDWAYFQTLARATHNIVFTFLLNSIRAVHERWGALFFSIPGTIDRTRRFHRVIARSIGLMKADRAASVTVKMLNYSNPLLMDGLTQFLRGKP